MVQVALLCMMLASVYATVTLASYDQNDPSFNQATMRPVQNVGGRAGAYLADLLLQAFGLTAWAVVPLTGLLAWLLAGRPLGGWARVVGSALLSWALMLALGLIFGADASGGYILGGYLGVTSAELLLGPLGPVGAWLSLAATLVLSLSLLTRIDWGRLAGKAVDGVEAGVPMVRGVGLRLGRSAVQGVRSAGGALVGAAPRRAGPEITVTGAEDEDDDELSDADDEPASEALRPPAPPVRVAQPAPRSAAAEPPAPEAPRGPVRIRTHEGAALPGRRVDARNEPLPPGLALQRHEASGLRPVRIGIAESAQRSSGLPVTTYEEPSLGLLSPPTARPPELGDAVPDRTQFARRSLAEVEWEPTGLERPDRTVAEPPWPVRSAPRVEDAPSLMDGFDRPRQAVRPPIRPAPAAPSDEDALDDEGEVWAEALARKPVAPARPLDPTPVAAPAPVRAPISQPRPVPDPEDEAEAPPPVILRPAGASRPSPTPAASKPARPPAPPPEDEDLDDLDDVLDDERSEGLDAPSAVADEELDEDDDSDAESDEVPAFVAPMVSPRRAGPAPAVAPAGATAGAAFQRAAVTPGSLISGGDDDGGVVIASEEAATFELPHLGLLDKHERVIAQFDEEELRALADTLEAKLADFGVSGEVVAIRPGPVITTFEYLPQAGIKLSRIAALEDDIAMALKALRVRIVAPIPGKGVVGFEVPNKKRQTVWIRDLLASDTFRKDERALPMSLGKNVEGKPEIADLASAPHLLVAGTTGSGKSVGVNAMLLSMLYRRTPEELRMILIDPKMLEFELYQDIPHLLHPVVTDPKLASAALKWACNEMDERYRLLARWQTRNIASYNEKVRRELAEWTPAKARKYAPKDWTAVVPPPPPRTLPYIVIVIDELADLMMVAAKDVEVSIARLAQKARAAGIHLIVATQRPEKTVVTGIIKANMPSRIAFQVRSKLDGRIILDQSGAEALLGKGDMLFLPPGVAELRRIHGPFVDDEEVRRVTDFLRAQGAPVYEAEIKVDDPDGEPDEEIEYDELYDQCVAYLSDQGKASTSMIQRQFKIGYNRAARIIEVMEKEGLVGPADGAKPRKMLVGDHAS
ncbi:MAG: DNA translocase FtsK 4TM domain-containing protein [Deltaproteobacteria bacterium]|nr:DNA translocase FtsK 4TM domain-containing protein [Deltaproteobacteria bacterium]